MKNCAMPLLIGLSITMATWAQAENPINQRTSQDQKEVCAIVYPTGAALAVWCSYGQDGSSGAIVARKLDSEGVPDGNEWIVNQDPQGYQAEPAIALSHENKVLVVWRGPHANGDSEEIVGRLFDVNGIAITNDIHINQNVSGEQSHPSVCALPSGSFAIAWESEGIDNSKKCICLRIVNSSGAPVDNEVVFSDTPSYTCRYTDIACDLNGVIHGAWVEDRSSNAIRRRRLDPNGTALGSSEQVNTFRIKSITQTAIAVNPAGYSLIAWDGDPNKGADDDVHARIYDPNGQTLTDQFQVNQISQDNQESPCVAAMPNGDFILAWQTPGSEEGNGSELAIRRFDPNGNPKSDETLLCAAEGDQALATLSTNGSSRYLALWQSKTQDSSGWDIHYQYGPTMRVADLNLDTQIDMYDVALWAQSWTLTYKESLDIYQDFQINPLDLWAISQQWLQSSPR